MRQLPARAALVGVVVTYGLGLAAAALFPVADGVLTVGLPTWVRLGGRLPASVPVGTLTVLPLPGAAVAGWLATGPSRGALAGFLAHLTAIWLPAAALLAGLGLLGAATTLASGGRPVDALSLLAVMALLALLATVVAAGFALGGAVAGGVGGVARLATGDRP